MLDLYKRVKQLEHKLNNVISFGTIKEVLLGNNVIVDLGNNLETPELPYVINSSGNAKVYFAAQKGDQVMVIAKGGSLHQAVVVPSIYKENVEVGAEEWRLEFASGSILYKAGKLEIKCEAEVTIESAKATIKADQIILGDDSGGEVVCKNHTCSFTGAPHTLGSSKIKGAM